MDGVTTKTRWKCLSGNALKMIAMVTMLIDHIGAAIIETGILNLQNSADIDRIIQSPQLMLWWQVDRVLRMIGRISFPIFCFLLVEGFLHTRNVKKYALRLLAFCLISEIPFDLAFWGQWFYLGYQNIFFTLFLGLLAMIGIKKISEKQWKPVLTVVAELGVVAVCCTAAVMLKTDYSGFGVFFIALLYMLRHNPKLQTVAGCISLLREVTAPLAFIPIRMYNGTRGKWNVKYLFYAFYPVHILILWAIRMWLF